MADQKIVDICECDVKDKETLALFRIKRDDWKRCLIDDDYSVFNQISHLLWNDTVFRTFNEARKLTLNIDDVGFNRPMTDLMDEGFVASQVMAIRRLSDPNFYDPNKAVISLLRIIEDIGNNLSVVTRENYICFDGSEYDGLSNQEDGINWFHWNNKQKNFDRLSMVSSIERSRKDKLNPKIISSLRSELSKCRDLRTYANKFIAHTSDNLGKTKLTDKQKSITLDKLDEAYKAIIKVSSFLGAVVLYMYSPGGIPVPQFNQLKNMDKPLIKTENLLALDTFWIDRGKEVSYWEQNFWPST